jgi:hypothetical protein
MEVLEVVDVSGGIGQEMDDDDKCMRGWIDIG